MFQMWSYQIAKDLGFIDGNTSGNDYTYDANGNMKTDKNKGITGITYNHLNLPIQVSFGSTNKIQYVYDATGIKLVKKVTDNSTVTNTSYAGNYIYEEDGTGEHLKFFSHSEGYVEPVGSGNFEYIYQYKDHLGNVRLTYADSDNNGSIDPSTEIISEKNYYPFGLKHKGYNNVVTSTNPAQNYKYNGKELNEELGLDWYDFGARNYDASLGRWMNLDPLAEQMRRHSPYNYAFDNPIYFVDPDGMFAGPFGDYFDSKGGYLGSDDIDDGKVYISPGNKKNFLTESNQEVPGGLASLGAIKTSLALTNAPSSHSYSPDTKGGLHEVRVDIDLDGVTSYTEGGKVTVDPVTNVASGEVNVLDVMMSRVDTSKSDIVGHSHPTKTIIEGDNAYTFDANSPTSTDKADFKNRDVSFISGNIESKTVTKTKNSDGSFTFNTPKNKQGAVFYNRNARPIMTIGIETINNILSNYEMGKLKN